MPKYIPSNLKYIATPNSSQVFYMSIKYIVEVHVSWWQKATTDEASMIDEWHCGNCYMFDLYFRSPPVTISIVMFTDVPIYV